MAERAPFFGITGAGISGLTLALALAKHGARVTVLERNQTIQEAGAGLQISPNATRVLHALGLSDLLDAHAFEPDGIDIFPIGAKKPLQTLTLGSAVRQRYGFGYYVMHRADLAQMLHDACRRFANIDIRFGVERFDLQTTGDALRLDFADASSTDTLKIDAFVGADGVHSRTRTEILGGPKAQPVDHVAWRTLMPMDRLEHKLSRTSTSLMWGPGFHAVAYPLAARGVFNVALFAPRPNSGRSEAKAPKLSSRARRDPRFAAILDANPDWTYWPLATVDAPVWHRGPIALMGDAAHAMLPFQAQGAAMGIEDAAALADALMRFEAPQEAFASYQQARQARVGRIAQTSVRNGEIFHMAGPQSMARNLVVKLQGPLGHFKRLDWIYAYAAKGRAPS